MPTKAGSSPLHAAIAETLAAYARASYFRELHGDLPGAAKFLKTAGDLDPSNVAAARRSLERATHALVLRHAFSDTSRAAPAHLPRGCALR